MTTIIAGNDATFTVEVKRDGTGIPVGNAATAQVINMAGEVLIAETALDAEAAGANWDAGIVVVEFSDTETTSLPVGEAILVIVGSFGAKRFKLLVETLLEPVRTSLFIRDIIVDELRSDRLMVAAYGVLGNNVTVTDDYLWEKVKAAESEMAHTLRVPLVPTRFFPQQPTQEQIEEMESAGMPWEIESAPDYVPEMFVGERWGYVVTRQKPVQSIESMKFVYPTEQNGSFDIPLEWLSMDAKYGHIRIVPTSGAVMTGLAGVTMLGVLAGKLIPSMVRLTYTAGIKDAAVTYPELIDCIKKKAVLKVITDAFLPQSGSISADGLSESISVDMDKYHSSVDAIINGTDGNGGLMSEIHGIRVMVM